MCLAQKVTVGFVALLWMGTPVAAQPSPRPETGKRPDVFQNMPSQLLKELGQKLDLTDEQKLKVVALKEEFEAQNKAPLKKLRQDVHAVKQGMQAARKKNDNAAVKKARAEIKALRQAGEQLHADFERKLLAILTDEQKKQYASLQQASAPAAPLRTDTQLSTSSPKSKKAERK